MSRCMHLTAIPKGRPFVPMLENKPNTAKSRKHTDLVILINPICETGSEGYASEPLDTYSSSQSIAEAELNLFT